MGTYPDGGRVFVKMNTTPILAGLAREQIAPQLLWSRRTAMFRAGGVAFRHILTPMICPKSK